MKTLLTLAVMLLLSSALHAAESEHPIDMELERAMNEDPSTAGMVQAISKAREKWDGEMNRAYGKLKHSMKPEEWQALVTAQRAWLAFRDAQVKSLGAFYANMQGTMWIPVSADDVMELTRERALFLQGMLDVIGER